jgi:integrase/recombinase XerC
VVRRNSRGGQSAAAHLISAARCLYQYAENDGWITPATNPARRARKPRTLASTRRAIPDARLAEINHVVATTGNDPELDTLILRVHQETACRRGGALALRPCDLGRPPTDRHIRRVPPPPAICKEAIMAMSDEDVKPYILAGRP